MLVFKVNGNIREKDWFKKKVIKEKWVWRKKGFKREKKLKMFLK